MKNLSKIALLAFAAISFTFASCESKPAAETEVVEEAAIVEGEADVVVAADSAVVAPAEVDTTVAPAQ